MGSASVTFGTYRQLSSFTCDSCGVPRGTGAGETRQMPTTGGGLEAPPGKARTDY